MRTTAKLPLRTRTNAHEVRTALCKIIMAELRNVFECRSKWAKLNCQQAEIAKKSYEHIDDGSVTSYMEKNPGSIN